MTIREQVAAYKAAVGPFASGEINVPLTTADAVALVGEIGTTGLRNPETVAAAAAAFASLPARPEDDAALAEWALERKKLSDAFWGEFAGEEIDGVNIVRRGTL